MKQLIAMLLTAAVIAVGAWALLNLSTDETVSFDPDDEALTAQGKAIYAANCATCHGVGLEGQPNWQTRGSDGLMPAPPHDPSGHTWHHPDRDLFALTKLGVAKMIGDPNYRSAMPAYEDILTDQAIIAALSYIKSTWPAEIRARHDQINEQATAKR